MVCQFCGLDLPDDSSFCRKCGRPLSPSPASSPLRSRKRILRWVVFSALCVVVALSTAGGTKTYRHFAQLRSSIVYRDAIAKAQNSPEINSILGAPIRSRLVPWGTLYSRGNFGSAYLISIISGSKGAGMLDAELMRDHGVWRYRRLHVIPFGAREPIDLIKAPAIDPAELHGSGRVYLLSFGPSKISLQKLAEHFGRRYMVTITVLPALPLDESVIDVHRDQAVAEEILSAMRHRIPQLATEKDAVAIAVTDRDMYARDWSYAFNYYDGRVAVVSTAQLNPHMGSLPGIGDLLDQRVRKLVGRDLGLIYYKLPSSNDPTSLMYSDLSDPSEVDRLQESYLGAGPAAVVTEYPVTHPVPPLEPVVRKDVAKGVPTAGDYPCLILSPASPADVQLQARTTSCHQSVSESSPGEWYEVALATGRFTLRHTDLFLFDSMPLALTRTYSSWDTRSLAFGVGASHPYETAIFGHRNPYTDIELGLADGSVVPYERISQGTGYRDALFEHTSTDGTFYGSLLRWNGNGWDLKFRDGSVERFPEAYWAINVEQCALVGMQSASGEQIHFERDSTRRLMRLVSPHGQQIRFSYDGGRIVRLSDGSGHDVDYVYDQGGRLERVMRSGAVVRRYSYEYSYLVSVADGSGNKLLVNKYDDTGRLESQTLADGSAWHFHYTVDKRNKVTSAVVIDPAGRRTVIVVPHAGEESDAAAE